MIRINSGRRSFAPAIEPFHACVLDGAEPLVPAENAAGSLKILR